jgi:hypothetical protein
VELVIDPDKPLSQAKDDLVATADSVILDRCGTWLALAREVVSRLPDVWRVDLSGPATPGAASATAPR